LRKELFKKALFVLECSRIPEGEWAIGGGVALELRFHHRESRDVDVFVTNAQYLLLITPRLNREVFSAVADYTESSNFLKLKFQEGEVDFIVAPRLTENPCETLKLWGKKVNIESPEEVVLKKLFYRAEALKARDVVDVAAVYENRRDVLLRFAHLLGPRIETISRRWDKLKEFYEKEAEGLEVLDTDLLKRAPLLFEEFLREVRKRIALEEKLLKQGRSCRSNKTQP